MEIREIIEIIEGERELRGIDLGDFCKGVGIDRVSYWRVLSGKVSLKADVMLRMCRVLGLDFMLYRDIRRKP